MQIDSIPSFINEVPNLKVLSLPNGNFTELPEEIGDLKKLRKLSLGSGGDECGGVGIRSVSPAIGGCESLVHLGLAYSEIADLPYELLLLKNLRIIDLVGNEVITEEQVEALRQRFKAVRILR